VRTASDYAEAAPFGFAPGQAPSRNLRGAISYSPSKAILCHSTRASRRIPVLFFRPQKVALIDSSGNRVIRRRQRARRF
jgi:hypothetical protein